jgi:hypothetical protein
MSPGLTWIAAGLVLANSALGAAPIAEPVAKAVSHPLFAIDSTRSSGLWKRGIERHGESLATRSLWLRGYEVLDGKLAGNKGIDLIGIKRDAVGTLTDVRLVEVKTHYGNGKPRLAETQHGIQTSRKWFTDRLMKLRSRGGEGRSLALEISRFRKSSGLPIERLGEVHDIKLRAGNYIIRDPVTLVERAGPISIPSLLNQVAEKLPADRPWALQHLAHADQISDARMAQWVTSTPSSRALERIVTGPVASIEAKQAFRGSRRVLARAAGRVALVVAILMDAHEIYGHVREYRNGRLTRQEFVIAMARSGGGIAGAWTGAAGGAWVGAWIGGFGGPVAWITVPVGGALGGAAGGIAGYFGGSYLGEAGAQAWYGSLDRQLKRRLDDWLTSTPRPVSE